MKKVIFLMAVITVYFISCRSSKQSMTSTTDADYYNDPFVQKYKGNPDFLPPDSAIKYINNFKKHAYRGWRKNKLAIAWSYFNPDLLKNLTKDADVNSIYFLFAAYPGKGIDQDHKRHPFIIMEAIPTVLKEVGGKGGANPVMSTSNAVFFMASTICPPPNTGCRIPGQ
ncbi:MAG: hypothetical protein ABIR50_04095 [Ginsengibacter sp.]